MISALTPIGVSAEITAADFNHPEKHEFSVDEQRAYEAALKRSTQANKQEELDRVQSIPGWGERSVNYSLVDAGLPRDTCDFKQRVFLRRSVQDLPLSLCGEDRPTAEGASFSLTADRKADETTVAVDAGIGVMLITPRTFQPDRANEAALAFEDLSLAAFVDADGDFSSSAADEGFIRAGLKLETEFGGAEGILDALYLGGSGYFQTDLGFGSRGYGAQFSIVPVAAELHLNGVLTSPDAKQIWEIEAVGIGDYFHLENAGGTGLSEDDFFWLGGNVTFKFEDRTIWENGLVFRSGVVGYWDVLNGNDAVKWTSGLDLKIDPEGRAAVGVEYNRGRDRQSQEFEDRAFVNFKVLF